MDGAIGGQKLRIHSFWESSVRVTPKKKILPPSPEFGKEKDLKKRAFGITYTLSYCKSEKKRSRLLVKKGYYR